MKNEIFYGDPIALNWKADDGAAATVRVQLSPFGEFTLRDGGRRSGAQHHRPAAKHLNKAHGEKEAHDLYQTLQRK